MRQDDGEDDEEESRRAVLRREPRVPRQAAEDRAPHGRVPGDEQDSSLAEEKGREEDDEEDTTVSTLLDLLEQYSSTSESDEASAWSEETSADSLVQSFLAQLEKYARSQDYLTQAGNRSGSLSVSA